MKKLVASNFKLLGKVIDCIVLCCLYLSKEGWLFCRWETGRSHSGRSGAQCCVLRVPLGAVGGGCSRSLLHRPPPHIPHLSQSVYCTRYKLIRNIYEIPICSTNCMLTEDAIIVRVIR